LSEKQSKSQVKPFFLIVGLGNPGAQYSKTRHNLGFQVIDSLAKRFSLTLKKLNQAEVGQININYQPVVLAKPLTFMNLSGKAVSFLLSHFRLNPSQLLVVHDDLDLPLATLRFKTKGSAGGHLGLLSIIEASGTDQFYRLRIGIGRPPGRKDPAKFVLENFTLKEEEQISVAIEQASDAVIDFLQKGAAYAMNKYNVKGSNGLKEDKK